MTLKTAEQIARRKLSQKASSRKQYAKNKVRRDATIAAWRAAHPDKVRELRWRAAEVARAKRRALSEAEKELIRSREREKNKASSRKQYAKNKVARDATIATWRKAHPDKVRELRWRAAVKRREQLRAESAEENLRRRTQTNDWKKAHPEQVKARLETYRKRKAIRAIHRVLETLSGICVPAQKLNLVDSPPAKPVG